MENYIPIRFRRGARNYADAAITAMDPAVIGDPGWHSASLETIFVSGTTATSAGDTVDKSGRASDVIKNVVYYGTKNLGDEAVWSSSDGAVTTVSGSDLTAGLGARWLLRPRRPDCRTRLLSW